jgi:hypothetical protein
MHILPKHIHIEKAEKTAKFNTKKVELVKSSRFNASELKQIRKLGKDNKNFLIGKRD